jgi:retinol dehydrogenase 12
MYGGLNFDTFRESPARKKLGREGLYLQSKFGNTVVAQELARRYGDQGIVATSLNPGPIDTDLVRHVHSRLQKVFLVRSIVKIRSQSIWLTIYHVRN